MDDFFTQIPLKPKLIGWSLLIGPFAALWLAAAIFLKPEPFERHALLGCYVAAHSPQLEITSQAIRIFANNAPVLGYEVEPAKQGYHLLVRPAFQLDPTADGQFSFNAKRGIGYFWPLLTSRSEDPSYLRKPTDFGGRFSLIASDGTEVIYTRSKSTDGCKR